VKSIARILPPTLGVDLRLSLRNILRHRRRSLIAILAIGFGVIAMMLTAGYIEWTFWSTREESTTNQLGHIQVSMPGYHANAQSDPYAYILPASAPALSVLNKLPEAKAVSPRLAFYGLVSHGETTLSFIAEGIDPMKDPYSSNILVIEGKLLAPEDPNGIVLGAGLAANLGVKTGDQIVLLANTAAGGMNAVEGRVRGLISTSMKEFDDNILRIDIQLARQLLKTEGAHLWVVTLKDTDLTDKAMEKLAPDPALKSFEITPWTKLADFYNKMVELFSQQMGVVKLIIAVIIVLSISNTMTMSVMERTVEIGTAMALGVRRMRILALFLMEGGLLGAVAGVVGVLIGLALAGLISWIGIPMPPAPGMSRGYVASIIITPSIVVEALLLAVLTTLLASIYPAWRASRLVIVDALRHNR